MESELQEKDKQLQELQRKQFEVRLIYWMTELLLGLHIVHLPVYYYWKCLSVIMSIFILLINSADGA